MCRIKRSSQPREMVIQPGCCRGAYWSGGYNEEKTARDGLRGGGVNGLFESSLESCCQHCSFGPQGRYRLYRRKRKAPGRARRFGESFVGSVVLPQNTKRPHREIGKTGRPAFFTSTGIEGRRARDCLKHPLIPTSATDLGTFSEKQERFGIAWTSPDAPSLLRLYAIASQTSKVPAGELIIEASACIESFLSTCHLLPYIEISGRSVFHSLDHLLFIFSPHSSLSSNHPISTTNRAHQPVILRSLHSFTLSFIFLDTLKRLYPGLFPDLV